MDAGKKFNHWRIETDSQNILWLTIDRQGASVNSLNREVFNEFDRVIDLIKEQEPIGVIIRSGKEKGFVAGADIKQFIDLKDEEEAFDLIRQAQLVLDKLETLSMPTVAMIKGFCLGGGYELALACTYRVAEDGETTKIGLPEIKLGIHPGFGGTVRLLRLIGAIKAMKIILPGAIVPAKKAEKIGMVDVAVPLRELERAACYFILNKPKPIKLKGVAAFYNHDLIRPLLGKIFLRSLRQKKVNKKHYPAPYAVVKNWIQDGAKGSKAYINEARSIAKLMITDTARNLVRCFFLQERLKSLAKSANFKPQNIHVIGAGTMGGDIAAWCALRGMHVTLEDKSPEKIAPAIKRAYKLFLEKLREPRLVQAALDRLQPDVSGFGIKRADVIIEAVFEDLETKQKIFRHVEKNASEHTILATNTSSIPLQDIGEALEHPEKLVGIHFFNPVDKMLLAEVVRAPKTSEEIYNKALAFVGKISRLPLPVKSHPGFLVNRVLMPYLMEAMELLEQGIPAMVIDKEALKFGMPMGPIKLADKVGLDICLSVAQNLTQVFGGKISEKLKQMVENGKLGVKSGEGFYQYDKKGKTLNKIAQETTRHDQDITDRLILRMLNEAVACLDEGIVEDADLLDAGMIFGTGFAPFRGGPMNYAKARGENEIVEILRRFADQYGERFKPHKGWQKLVLAKKPAKKKATSSTKKKINNNRASRDSKVGAKSDEIRTD